MAFYWWLVGNERWWVDYALSAATVGLIAILGGLYAFQTKLIYVPNFPPGSRCQVWRPSRFGLEDFEEVWLNSSDGTKLHAFWIPAVPIKDGARARHKYPTILLFHANAGNMGHRLPLVRRLMDLAPANFLLLSYRGYGESEGTAHEAGIKMDAQAALEYAQSRMEVDNTRLLLYGQSIGGAVAIDVAARNIEKIAGVVVENTFRSIPALVPHLMPALRWARRLCHQHWDSERRLREMVAAAPPFPRFLFLSGGRDELVPPEHMRVLYEIARKGASGDKDEVSFEKFETGTHNDTCLQTGYFEAIADFIRQFH